MKSVVIGAHLRREDIEPLADPIDAGLWLSAIPLAEDQPLGDRELLLRVAAVRARLLEKATFIAIRYGFTVNSAEEARAKIAEHAARWRRVLEAHEHDVEMTLKVPATSPRPRPNRKDFTSGAAYLKALHEATNAASIDAPFRDAVERQLVPLTKQHRWTHRDEKSLECAMLIARERLDAFHAAGENLRATGAAFLLSGPWPLEVFADDDHE
jgi:hypothetical protein